MASPAAYKRKRSEKETQEPQPPRVFVGTVVQAPRFGDLTIDQGAVVVVSQATGIIEAFYGDRECECAEALAAVAAARAAGTLRSLGCREFLLPGFVDCHLHAPQFSTTGTGLDLPLMGPEGWLEQYTFPSERSLGSSRARAEAVYERVVGRTLQVRPET